MSFPFSNSWRECGRRFPNPRPRFNPPLVDLVPGGLLQGRPGDVNCSSKGRANLCQGPGLGAKIWNKANFFRNLTPSKKARGPGGGGSGGQKNRKRVIKTVQNFKMPVGRRSVNVSKSKKTCQPHCAGGDGFSGSEKLAQARLLPALTSRTLLAGRQNALIMRKREKIENLLKIFD